MQLEMCAVTPRIPADDLQLLCTGSRRLENFEFGFNETHTHLADMGAKLAPKKSIVFSSDETSRRWLRKHRWRRVGATIQVITDGKDLGAHMNASTNRTYGATLTKRMQETTNDI